MKRPCVIWKGICPRLPAFDPFHPPLFRCVAVELSPEDRAAGLESTLRVERKHGDAMGTWGWIPVAHGAERTMIVESAILDLAEGKSLSVPSP